jgi:hypothetical protein
MLKWFKKFHFELQITFMIFAKKRYPFIINHDYTKVISNFIKIVIMQLLMSLPYDVKLLISNDFTFISHLTI